MQSPIGPISIYWYLGDGKCQVQLNNIQNLFDAGDCCVESPECQSFLGYALGETIKLIVLSRCAENQTFIASKSSRGMEYAMIFI